LVQDTLLEAFRDFDSFRGQTLAEFALWLTHILRHNLLDAARHFHQVAARDPSREVSLEGERLEKVLVDDSNGPTAGLDRRERENQVMVLLSGISPEGQRVLWLRLVEEYSYAEIAQKLNSTEAAVRQACSRALQACRQAFLTMYPPG
jgi:RNA polymerase sigma-70 factor (subfamily 1)